MYVEVGHYPAGALPYGVSHCQHHSWSPTQPPDINPTIRDSRLKEKEGVARLGSANEWVALVLTEVARVGARGVVVAGDNEEYISAVMHHARVS